MTGSTRFRKRVLAARRCLGVWVRVKKCFARKRWKITVFDKVPTHKAFAQVNETVSILLSHRPVDVIGMAFRAKRSVAVSLVVPEGIAKFGLDLHGFSTEHVSKVLEVSSVRCRSLKSQAIRVLAKS